MSNDGEKQGVWTPPQGKPEGRVYPVVKLTDQYVDEAPAEKKPSFPDDPFQGAETDLNIPVLPFDDDVAEPGEEIPGTRYCGDFLENPPPRWWRERQIGWIWWCLYYLGMVSRTSVTHHK